MSQESTNTRRKAAALWLGAALCLTAAALLGAHLAPRVQRGLESYGWEATDGVLLSAVQGRAVDVHVEDHPETHWVSIRYAYSVPDAGGGRRDLTGVRFDVDTGGGKENGRGIGSAGKALMAARDAPAVTVHYDPLRPANSVLRPGISHGAAWLFVPLFLLFGVGVSLIRMALGARDSAGVVLLWAPTFGIGAPILIGSLTVVMQRWLDRLPSPWWAIGVSVAALSFLFAPRLFRMRGMRTMVGLTAPVFALLLLNAMGLVIYSMGVGVELPSWTPTTEESLARLSHANARVRESACWTIARTEESTPAPETVAALVADSDDDVAAAAMFVVKERGVQHPGIARALTVRLDDPNESLRQTAAWRLSGQKHADPDAAMDGAFALLRGGETSMRAGLTLLVQIGRGRLDAAEAVAHLVRDPASPVRGQAIWTLEVMQSDHEVAMNAVFAALAEGDESLRRTAVHYLATVGRAVEPVPGLALDAIAADLAHVKPARRQDAARALARLGPGALAVREVLAKIAGSDDDALTRHLAAEAVVAVSRGRG
ncbi:MAG: DUF3592 domain-containing protein [bacterium]|nr:DUF3592 domain-containing protein [bacterium]